MKLKKAFTLIELLVVIAIIAILAAILFPVFAQAKLAAKKSVTVSNLKQLGTALVLYENDNEDTTPLAMRNREDWQGANWCYGWAMALEPYAQTYNIFRSPIDSKPDSPISWNGVGISFAPNAAQNYNYTAQGVFGLWEDGNGYWSQPSPTSSQIVQPAATIAMAERHNDVLVSVGSDNTTLYSCPFYGFTWIEFLGIGALTPDGSRNPSTAFPYGPNGAVTTDSTGKAIFSFADSHAKALSPTQTDPDFFNQPAKNMWDRSQG